jgi:hypothetical protein
LGTDISEYLATQGRHAIAHAEREDIVDPDDPDDHHRIHMDKPLMRHLAELAMTFRRIFILIAVRQRLLASFVSGKPDAPDFMGASRAWSDFTKENEPVVMVSVIRSTIRL